MTEPIKDEEQRLVALKEELHNSLLALGIKNFTISINNRKILNGLAQYLKVEDILRIDRLIAVLEKLELIKEHNTTARVLILNIDERYVSNIYQLATKLNIKTEVYSDTMKFKKQMKYANLQGHEFVIILGENEVNGGVITLKNMESREQVNLGSLEELVEEIKG